MPPDAISPLSTFQQSSLLALRTFIGWHFLYEGYYKLSLPAWTPEGQPLAAWSSAGFIRAATGPMGRLARAVAEAGLLPWIDRAIIVGLLAVGLSLMLGLLTRAGCIGGVVLLVTFYLTAIPTVGLPQSGAEGTYLFVNKTLIEGLAVLALMSFDTGRIAGLDRWWLTRGSRRVTAPAPSPSL